MKLERRWRQRFCRRGTTIVVVAITVALGSTVTRADRDKARAAYEEAVRRYDLNEFQTALEYFKKAYLEYEEPSFLFNIAQCHRQMGDKQQAILFYRSYVRKVPDAANADEVRHLIATLDSALQREKEAAPVPRPVLESPRVSPPKAVQEPNPTGAARVVRAAPPSARRQPLHRRW